MQKTNEFRDRALACRKMASDPLIEDERRAMLVEMAEAWDRLAEERKALLERRARIKSL